MKNLRPRKQIVDCLQEAKVILWDKKTGNELTVQAIDILIDLISLIKTNKEFIESIEVIRFVNTIDDFLLENKSKDQSFEFYAQHRKEINNQKSKALVFQKKFRIINLSTFKLDFKKRNWYPPVFWDEKLRMNIISAQNCKCAMCNADVSEIIPHLHHIDYNKMNCSRENLVFLCVRCHGKTNSNREFWKQLLIEKQKEIFIMGPKNPL